MQYRVYSRRNLGYVDSGFVSNDNVSIDNDYLVDNNSIISFSKDTDASIGDFIALIKDSGAFEKGVIVSVDNSEHKIAFKKFIEAFNNNIVNPYVSVFSDTITALRTESLSLLISKIITTGFINNKDTEMNLPIGGFNIIEEGDTQALYKYTDNSINVKEMLLEYFNSANLIVDFDITFKAFMDSERNVIINTSKLLVKIYIPTSTTKVFIKDNIIAGTMVYTENSVPDTTSCVIIDDTSKKILAIYYLKSDNTVTTDPSDSDRILPSKAVIASYTADSVVDTSDSSIDRETALLALAEENLLGQLNNTLVQYEIPNNTKAINLSHLSLGDKVEFITELGNIYTIYTGRKISGNSNYITLMFGKARKNYTDKIQLALRKIYKKIGGR